MLSLLAKNQAKRCEPSGMFSSEYQYLKAKVNKLRKSDEFVNFENGKSYVHKLQSYFGFTRGNLYSLYPCIIFILMSKASLLPIESV